MCILVLAISLSYLVLLRLCCLLCFEGHCELVCTVSAVEQRLSDWGDAGAGSLVAAT